MTDIKKLVDCAARWLRDEQRRRLAGLPLSPESAAKVRRNRRVLVRELRAAVEAGDWLRALTYFGNDSDAGFRFVEAALPLVPVGIARASFVEDAWLRGLFGEHSFVTGRRVRGAELVRRANKIFRQVPAFSRELPEAIVVFRGVTGAHPERGALHPSWSLRRDIAAWFALRSANDEPYVLVARFSREAVHAIFNSRDESEVVVDAFAADSVTVTQVTDEDRAAVEGIYQKRRDQAARRLTE